MLVLEIKLITNLMTGGRGFVKRKDEQGKETVYAVSAMHQLRCLVRVFFPNPNIPASFET